MGFDIFSRLRFLHGASNVGRSPGCDVGAVRPDRRHRPDRTTRLQVHARIVHVVRDLVDHHYRHRRLSVATLLPRERRSRGPHPRRTRILGRMEAVERLLLEEGCTSIVYAAHSQGSVIVYEHLRRVHALSPERQARGGDVRLSAAPHLPPLLPCLSAPRPAAGDDPRQRGELDQSASPRRPYRGRHRYERKRHRRNPAQSESFANPLRWSFRLFRRALGRSRRDPRSTARRSGGSTSASSGANAGTRHRVVIVALSSTIGARW